MKSFIITGYTLFLAFMGFCQTGTIIHHADFQSAFINKRNVDVWLPPSYSKSSNNHYPVIYMHDGQNLFADSVSGFGVEWGVDESIIRLSKTNKIPECIVVGIWNTPQRYPEYQPQKPYENLEPEYKDKVTEFYGGLPQSDNYLKFIVEELKPFIDGVYQTKTNRENTFIMGSSMGGLISLYALCEYPDIFYGAACLSTHWVTYVDLNNGEMARVMEEYLEEKLPEAGNHIIYFDRGTKNLDAYYGVHQAQIDELMVRKGYVVGENWESLTFEGADHNEISWQERLYIPLEFLLK